jgi:putative hydrolase of the HAD superfamily
MAAGRKLVSDRELFMLRHIIFDLGNVLVNIHPNQVMEEFAKSSDLDAKEISSFFLSDFHMKYMSGGYSTQEFYNQLKKEFHINLDFNEFLKIWNKVIGSPKDGIGEVIDKLALHYPLSICSNTDPVHWNYCVNNYNFLSKFTNYFLSFEIGSRKPNRQIFRTILDTLNARPEECLLIDDTYENIETARGMGFCTIHANDTAKVKQELLDLKVRFE